MIKNILRRCGGKCAYILIAIFLTVSSYAEEVGEMRDATNPVVDKIIHLNTVIPVGSQRAFEYFVDNDLLEIWLTVSANVDGHVGGRFELFWEPDDPDNNSTIGCHITAMTPNEMISFQWRSPKQFKSFANSADPLTHVVVSFFQEGANSTGVHLVHSGWRSAPEWEEARTWQERSWNIALGRLKRLAEQESQTADRRNNDSDRGS